MATPKSNDPNKTANQIEENANKAINQTQENVNKFTNQAQENMNRFNEKAKENAEKMADKNYENLSKVKDTLKDSYANFKRAVGIENAPEFVKETLDAQENLAENWFNSLIQVASAKSPEELRDIFNRQVRNFQKNVRNAMDMDYWKRSNRTGEEWGTNNMVSTEYAKETFIKMIDLFQPATNDDQEGNYSGSSTSSNYGKSSK